MKHILLLLAFFALAPRSDAADSFRLTKHPRFDTNAISAKAQMLLATLKPGMTRAQMGNQLQLDGGPWFTPLPVVQRLWFDDKLAGGKVIKFEVAFRPVGMDSATFADPKKQADWFRTRDWFKQDTAKLFQPDDVVVAIGTPYLDLPISD